MNLSPVKAAFFDRAAVADRVDPAVRKAFSRFGAFVRRRAKSSIRKRKAVSEPGKPPSSHVGTLKKFILFSYDAAAKSVVVGPTLFGPKSGAPEALEHGSAAVRKRPYMTPAFAAELPGVAGDFRDLIRR